MIRKHHSSRREANDMRAGETKKFEAVIIKARVYRYPVGTTFIDPSSDLRYGVAIFQILGTGLDNYRS